MLTYLFVKMKLKKMIPKNSLKRLRLIKVEIRLAQLIVGGILVSLGRIRIRQSVMVATKFLRVVEENMELHI